MTTTCNHALFAIVDVFTQYYEILGPLLMDDIFVQLQWCITQGIVGNIYAQQYFCWDYTYVTLILYFKWLLPLIAPADHEQLARSGTHCFEHMVISSGSKFTPAAWNSTCNFLKTIFAFTRPESLLTWKPSKTSNSSSTPDQVVSNHVNEKKPEELRRQSSLDGLIGPGRNSSPIKTVSI